MLFAKGGRNVENIPLMLDGLKQLIKRLAFQAIKWTQYLIKNPSSGSDMGLASKILEAFSCLV